MACIAFMKAHGNGDEDTEVDDGGNDDKRDSDASTEFEDYVEKDCTLHEITQRHINDFDDEDESDANDDEIPKTTDNKLYHADRVVDHMYTKKGKLLLLTKWIGYKTLTWQTERSLSPYFDLVADYCNAQVPRIDFKIKETVGANRVLEDDIEYNPDNWVTLQDVVKRLNWYAKPGEGTMGAGGSSSGQLHYSYATDMEIVAVNAFSPPPRFDKPKLVLLLYKSHFFVILYEARTRLAYGSDATGFLLEKSYKKPIEKWLDHGINVLRFRGTLRVDQCGAAAVVIGLQLIRMYKQSQLDLSTIYAPPKMLKRFISEMHPYPSASFSGRKSIAEWERYKCEKCSYKSSKLMSLRTHMLKHKNK